MSVLELQPSLVQLSLVIESRGPGKKKKNNKRKPMTATTSLKCKETSPFNYWRASGTGAELFGLKLAFGFGGGAFEH